MKFGTCISLILAAAVGAFADERLDRLPPEDRKWLEEEVVYIITEREKDVFLELQTVEERRLFIEAFWRNRDPNDATPENEVREEHYRRIEHANHYLGRDSNRAGWRTDRGRMYIILGEPRNIQRFEGYGDLFPAELWFYQGDTATRLPPFFYLLFFIDDDVGEFELYHPVMDGPGALLRGQLNIPSSNNMEALGVLRRISPELVRASLSFDTSEPADVISGRPSLGHDLMISRVEESPKRAVRADYADAYLRYGERVSADYSFNFVPSRSLFTVLEGPHGTPFVHYTLEIDAENFNLATDEDQIKYYTTLDISLEVRDLEGNLVLAKDRAVYLEVTPSQLLQIRLSPFAYQEDFPLVPGDYSVSVTLRNRVGKRYTVAEHDLHVESTSKEGPALSDVILGFRIELVEGGAKGEMRAFQIGNLRIHPAPEGVFTIGETVHLFSQLHNAGPGYRLRFAIRSSEQVFQERTTEIEDYQGGPVIEQFLLTDMVGGDYELQTQLMDASGSVVAEKSARLQVSPRTSILRPGFIHQITFNVSEPGLLSFARGEQLLNLKRFEEASKELEEAVAANNPQLPMVRWKLAALYIASEQPDRAMELLLPMEEDFSGEYEVVGGLGLSFYLKGDFPKATEYMERAIELRPPDTLLLNALGYCHLQLGNAEKAKDAFERSLELDPEQNIVKELLVSVDKNESEPLNQDF